MKKYLPLIAAIALAGCATKDVAEKRAGVDAVREQAQAAMERDRVRESSSVSFLTSSYVPLRKVAAAEFSLEQREVLNVQIETNRTFKNLNEVAGWLSSVANVPVFTNTELMSAGAVPGAPGALPGASPIGAPTAPGAAGSVNPAMVAASKPLSTSYSGAVSGFLDMVAANYGIFWKMEGRGVRFLLNESRTFRIKALPGDTQLTSLVTIASNSSGTSGSGASGSATTSTSTATGTNAAGVTFSGLSVWGGIESSVRQLLTPLTGRVAVSPSTGTISVTDTPRVLERVEQFIKDQNASLSRQVAVNVRVLSVEVSDSEDYGINWNAVYNNLSSNVAFKISSTMPVSSDAAQFVLQTSTPSGNSWGAASGAIISALSTQGRVSELTSANLVTLNNQPAPVNIGRQVSYLASSSTTLTSTAGSTTSLQAGQVQTGFSMVLLPHIVDGKEVLLQASVNLSSLLGLPTITSGGSSIQSPDVSTSNFIQRVRINSGDTLVIAGFDQEKLSAVAAGVGNADNAAMGSRRTSGKRNILVIIIQPTVAA
jgi:type IVB pilus formation R64 PilN family outer membrane protein